MDEDFGDVRYGDIRASDAQITTRRIMTAPSPELPASQSPTQEVASQDQLLQLRAQYDAAELLAKTAKAEARAARARKMTQQLDLETRAQALRSNSSSPRASPTASSPRAWSPPAPSQQGTDLAAVLLHLEAQRRNDALQREEERRREQRARDEDRRADRQAAEERAAQTEAHHQAQLAALMAASHPARTTGNSYVVGRALANATSVFTGDGTADCGTYLRTLERLFKAHGIPDSHWPNELFIKLAGQAKGWYEHAFPDPDTFPPWSQLTSGMLSRFGPRYAAADAWASTCSATRQEGESGLAALQRLDELQQASLLLGLPTHIGPIEKQCYQLQRLLSSEEKRVWSAAANALSQVSDDAIRALEVTAAAAALATTGRQSLGSSVPIDERDAWFEPRLAHLLTFLKDQPGHPLGAGRRQPARAAAIYEATGDTHPTPPQAALLPVSPPLQAPPTPMIQAHDGSVEEARCIALRANREMAARRPDKPVPPPAYEGTNATANQAEFEKRKACGACYLCPMRGPGKVNYAIFHTQCPAHGRSSTPEDRRNSAKRVTGSGSTF